jgi:hypothetical protein
MTEFEREGWIAFRRVVTKFLGNNKDPDYVTVVANMLKIFEVLGCLMSLKFIHVSEVVDSVIITALSTTSFK